MNTSSVQSEGAGPPSYLLARLESGERLLWWGLPDSEKLAINYLAGLLISLVFGAIGLGGTINAILRNQLFGSGAPLSSYTHLIFYAIFAVAGLVGAYLSSRTILHRHEIGHGLTDRRLIIVTGERYAKSFGAKAFRHIKRKGKQRGTIWFNYDGESFSDALYGIPDSDHVEQLLRQQFPPPPKQRSFWRPFG